MVTSVSTYGKFFYSKGEEVLIGAVANTLVRCYRAHLIRIREVFLL